MLLTVERLVPVGAPDVKEPVIQVALDRARIIVHTIVVNRIVMERVLVALWSDAPIALAKELTLVVNVVADVIVGVGVALVDAEDAKVIVYPVVLVPPTQESIENVA